MDLAPRTALALFEARVAEAGPHVALRHKRRGRWLTTTWDEWREAARQLAAGLVRLGVGPGDRVAICAETQPVWVIAELAILMAGAVVVPIYPAATAAQARHILDDAAVKVALAGDPHLAATLLAASDAIALVVAEPRAELERPDAAGRLAVELGQVAPPASPSRARITLLADLCRPLDPAAAAELATRAAAIDPAQAATVVYTSGTTGPAKGVVLSHGNLVFECEALRAALPLGPDDEQLLFLPLAHSFARVLVWGAIAVGARTAFAEGIAQLMANLAEVRPSFMAAVPRVYEKAYARMQAAFAAEQGKPIARFLHDWALGRGRRRDALGAAGRSGWDVRLADRLVFDKVKQIFGGRIRFFVSGGAPLLPEVSELFHAVGLDLLEGYGLTECTGAATLTRPGAVRHGSVGTPLPGVEVSIATDGEILIRGRNVMTGYLGQPEATAQAIDRDGWLHTGDIGRLEPAGHLTITDRKKDVLVTAGGKNVAPHNLETELKARCALISYAAVFGDGRRYLTALVTLDQEVALRLAAELGLGASDLATLSRDQAIRGRVAEAVDAVNATVASFESIKKFEILQRDFSVEGGELTPTLKLRRRQIATRHAEVLERLYRDGDEP